VRLYREAADAARPNPSMMRGLAGAHAAVGMSEMRLGQLERALGSFREGAATLEMAAAAEPRDASLRRALMLAYGHVGDVLGNPDMRNLGDRGGALEAYRRAAEIGRRLYESDRSDQRTAAGYGIVLSQMEAAMDDKDSLQKLGVQRESLRVLDEAARNSPEDVTLQLHRALVALHLGDTLSAAGSIEDARLAYLDSAAIAEAGLKPGHGSLLVPFMRSNERLAVNAVTRARRADALVFAARALRATEHPPADAASARAGARGCSAMGLTYVALLRSPMRHPGDREDALAWLRKAADGWHAAESDSALEAQDQREMREVEEALTRIERR
jgi:tetratricopeptide (TPR) repeat protein